MPRATFIINPDDLRKPDYAAQDKPLNDLIDLLLRQLLDGIKKTTGAWHMSDTKDWLKGMKTIFGSIEQIQNRNDWNNKTKAAYTSLYAMDEKVLAHIFHHKISNMILDSHWKIDREFYPSRTISDFSDPAIIEYGQGVYSMDAKLTSEMRVIDLKSGYLNQDDANCLAALLMSPDDFSDGKLHKNVCYKVINPKGKVENVILNASITERFSNKFKGEKRYQVHGDYRAQGAYGKVKEAPRYIIYAADGTAHIKNVNHIVKTEVLRRAANETDEHWEARVSKASDEINQEQQLTRGTHKQTKPLVVRELRSESGEVVGYKYYRYMPDLGRDLTALELGKGVDYNERFQLLADAHFKLEQLHKNNIVHCDIKPDNMFIDSRGQVEFADFGLSLKLNPNQENLISCRGTPGFMAPEVIMERGQKMAATTKLDVYSMGITDVLLLGGSQQIMLPGAQYFDKLRGKNLQPGELPPELDTGEYLPDNIPHREQIVRVLNLMLENDSNIRLDNHALPYFFLYLKNEPNPRSALGRLLNNTPIANDSDYAAHKSLLKLLQDRTLDVNPALQGLFLSLTEEKKQAVFEQDGRVKTQILDDLKKAVDSYQSKLPYNFENDELYKKTVHDGLLTLFETKQEPTPTARKKLTKKLLNVTTGLFRGTANVGLYGNNFIFLMSDENLSAPIKAVYLRALIGSKSPAPVRDAVMKNMEGVSLKRMKKDLDAFCKHEYDLNTTGKNQEFRQLLTAIQTDLQTRDWKDVTVEINKQLEEMSIHPPQGKTFHGQGIS